MEFNQQNIESLIQQLDVTIGSRKLNDIIHIDEIKIEENNVHVNLGVQPTLSEEKIQIIQAIEQAVIEVFKEVQVHVHLSAKFDPNAAAKKAHEDKRTSRPFKNIIAVASGKGGVGKSTVSVNLALALSRQGYKVGLMDADLYGPSIPLMLGLKGQKPKVVQQEGKHKIIPLESYGIKTISIGFVVNDKQAVMLRGPRLSGIIKQFFDDVLWGELDYLVIDLPPGTGDIHLTMVQTAAITGGIIVTTPQAVALEDARKAVGMFTLPTINVPILGIVENMSWFTPEELPDNKYYIFGKGGGEQLSKEEDVTLLGQIPLVQSIREQGDSGRPIVLEDNLQAKHFIELAKNVVKSVRNRNEQVAPTEKVKITTQ